jgi:hypothetical protein
MKTEQAYEFSFSNTCMCLDSDHNDDWVMFEALQIDCNGLCWELALEDFTLLTIDLFDENETLWWKVSNLGLWDGNHSGYGYAMCAEDLLSLMTVNSEWNIKGKVFNDRIEYSLSHHDSLGSNTVLTMVSEEQREELGLY